MQDLAIILTGGGMKATYSVGAVISLIEDFGIKNPQIILTGSASAGTASYYTSGQFDGIGKIWSELLSTKKLINPLRFWKILDIDYLIDFVFKKQCPLKEQKVYDSETKEIIFVTNSKTGKLKSFSNKDGENIFELMRATKAIPFVYGKEIEIRKEKYIDTYISSLGINFKIQRAIQEGAKNILVLSHLNIDENYHALFNGKFNENLFNLWLDFKGSRFKRNYQNQWKLDQQRHIYGGANIFKITPETKVKTGMLDNNNRRMKNSIFQGYIETRENEGLKEFLKNI